VNTLFRASFEADLAAIENPGLLRRIKKVVEQVEAAQTFQHIPNLKRLDAKGKYYRIRLGDYRIGFVFEHGA
jgi:mRNA interferase RelE/StbE